MDCLLECSLTNAYTGCGTSTLNFIERFCLGLVHSASKLNAKCTQMNYEMNCITMQNVLQCTPNGPSSLASASLVLLVLLLSVSSYIFVLSREAYSMPCAFVMQALTGKSSGKCTGIMQHFALLVLMLLLSSLAHTTYS